MYCIVEFAGPQKEIAVAVSSWILEGNRRCYWPPFWKNATKLATALISNTVPDSNSWSIYDIHVVGDRYFGEQAISY